MKRKNYDISINGKFAVTKHAWKTARYQFGKVVVDNLPFGTNTAKVVSDFKYKKEDGELVFGQETWMDENGREYVVEIRKRAE